MKRVLVVDDDRQTLDLVSRWLTAAGYEVQGAGTFGEGRLLIKDPLDVLIVDVRLHGFNGLQLAARARADHPKMRIVVVSGWEDPVLIREAGTVDAVFLNKPFSEADLLRAVGDTSAGSDAKGV